MDKQVNHRVKEALIKIKGILNECGIETKTCTWDPWYKELMIIVCTKEAS